MEIVEKEMNVPETEPSLQQAEAPQEQPEAEPREIIGEDADTEPEGVQNGNIASAEPESIQPEETPLPEPQPEEKEDHSEKTPDAEQKEPAQAAVSDKTGNNASKKELTAEEKAKKRQKRRKWSLPAFLLLIFLFSAYSFRSEAKHIYSVAGEKNFAGDLSGAVTGVESDSLSTVYNLPKVYILPWNEEPGPVPDENRYSTAVDENGTEVTTYEDETITVKYWVERQRDSNVYFAEVWIAHPTQLRTMLAGSYTGTKRVTPQRLAQKANAVVAINGDYFGYRPGGIIIRQGTKYRDWALAWDMLLIDSDGDFHIMSDYDARSSGVMKDYNIVNTLEFGPSLIIDGEINIINIDSGCGKEWNLRHDSPRTAIGQIGRLHYLMCCVEGRVEGSAGVRTPEMAEIMLEKGCVQAYNLDGGMSTTMVLGGNAMNAPMWGGQRVVSEIIYFATALPEEEQ